MNPLIWDCKDDKPLLKDKELIKINFIIWFMSLKINK